MVKSESLVREGLMQIMFHGNSFLLVHTTRACCMCCGPDRPSVPCLILCSMVDVDIHIGFAPFSANYRARDKASTIVSAKEK